jgi:demethylmenaquinone methyltransferase/2-methoxy-6-polyprenyl-1,4-benzoquinol methylase
MFSAIAPRYDLLNRVLSAGRDRAWRREAIRAAALPPGGVLLDVCTGTADMALEAVRRHPGSRVAGVDFSAAMLALGARKVARCGVQDRVALAHGSAEALPFRAACFDAACVAFGLRNVADRAGALREMCRVLRPGGRAVVLEFATPSGRLLRGLYLCYFHRVLPRIGRLVSGHPTAYAYLPASVAEFPRPDGLAAWMRAAGLRDVSWRTMTGGIVAIHVGAKGGT